MLVTLCSLSSNHCFNMVRKVDRKLISFCVNLIIGTFCDRQKDCSGPDLCCVREPAINPVISICKPALDEHETCGPYNQFRTVYIGGTVQPVCGPCKQGLVCKQVG